ncbi:MAG: phospholipid scramblase family protein [Pseudobdellovibrio sp.]|nr:phospholipid scramblase family protein [Pseudobdellovibrio sp.]
MILSNYTQIFVKQRRELAELFGFETRNKYEIYDNQKNVIGFAAEQQKGFLGILLRQLLGHWRSFELHFFDAQRQQILVSKHPFRWIFQEFEIVNQQGVTIGSVKQRFGILKKKFDVHNQQGDVIYEMRSGFFQFWTFPFFDRQGHMAALIQKKWSGGLKEIFMDADNFNIEFKNAGLSENDRLIILVCSVFTDLQYFERKAN